jgi:hypothetical protein
MGKGFLGDEKALAGVGTVEESIVRRTEADGFGSWELEGRYAFGFNGIGAVSVEGVLHYGDTLVLNTAKHLRWR